MVTLKGGELAYRMLVEAMGEGAATLSSDGAVLYSNRKFAEMIRRPSGRVAWIANQALVFKAERVGRVAAHTCESVILRCVPGRGYGHSLAQRMYPSRPETVRH